jgi:hypothetical protein
VVGRELTEPAYIVHADKPVLLMDFTNMTDYRVLPPLIDRSIALATISTTHHSVLALIDVTGTRVSSEVRASLKKLSQNNGPFIKAIAFVGFNPFWSTLMSGFVWLVRKRNHNVFKERSNALQWLSEQ